METSKAFLRLPIASRGVLTRYKTDRDLTKLFSAINSDIASQNTIQSRGVRRSSYRGILRNVFKMSNAQMVQIEAQDTEKQDYFNALKAGQNNQHEDKVDLKLLNQIMAVSPIMELMIRSGLRISELLDNQSKLTKKRVQFKLNKKKDNAFYDIKIIGSIPRWNELYKKLKADLDKTPSKSTIDKINLKLKDIIPSTFYKQSSHIGRAIYARYLYKFKSGDIENWTLPRIISTFLHHDNTNASAYYQHVVLCDDVGDILQG